MGVVIAFVMAVGAAGRVTQGRHTAAEWSSLEGSCNSFPFPSLSFPSYSPCAVIQSLGSLDVMRAGAVPVLPKDTCAGQCCYWEITSFFVIKKTHSYLNISVPDCFLCVRCSVS